jgi:hypothetical protein
MPEVVDWLKTLGMSEYAERFAESDIDFAILSDLTDQDLEKIGVASLGHRRKLLRAIANLEGIEKSGPVTAIAAAPPATPRPADTAERRQITVMFSDLVGSTALLARIPILRTPCVLGRPIKNVIQIIEYRRYINEPQNLAVLPLLLSCLSQIAYRLLA